jgi:transcriptional regulator with PAS, ATPase and Fis domain
MIIPPLRSRSEDILALSEHFISLFNETFNANVVGMDKEVKELILNYPWKGNVRELKNFIEYLFNFITSGWITLEKSGNLIHRKLEFTQEAVSTSTPSFSINEMEKEMIEKALEYVKKNNLKIEDASIMLGIGRATLFRKIIKYRIDTKYQIDTFA